MTQNFPPESAQLPGGGRMPLLGFGTWQLSGDDAFDAVTSALDVGYRHIDTATVYGNETEVGAALSKSGIDRGDVFITTKMPGDRGGQERTTLAESLDKLGVDRVDLWLIHWPTPDADVDMWKALLHALEQGQAAAVGVSNHSLQQIDELGRATGVLPAVNQIAWSPLLFDQAVLEGHRERGVLLEGYSAFRGGTLEHPVIVEMSQRRNVTPAQVIVRWHLQHGIVVIPKSAHPDRIRSNADVTLLELSDTEMRALDSLSKGLPHD